MTRHKVSMFIPVGLILFSTGLLLHNFIRGNYSDFFTGLLIGTSLPMMIAGFLKQCRSASDSAR